MRDLRAAVTALVIALLVVGWGGAAWAAMEGKAGEWAIKADAAPIRLLALVVLVAAVVLAFMPDREIPE